MTVWVVDGFPQGHGVRNWRAPTHRFGFDPRVDQASCVCRGCYDEKDENPSYDGSPFKVFTWHLFLFQSKSETKRRAQVHDAAIVADASGRADVTRTIIHHAERGAEDIRVRNAPAGMVENVTEPREELQPHSLHHVNILEDRGVPRKRVAIANEKNLSKVSRRFVRQYERGIGSEVRTNQTRIDRQKL